jgi:hypothetical protein
MQVTDPMEIRKSGALALPSANANIVAETPPLLVRGRARAERAAPAPRALRA